MSIHSSLRLGGGKSGAFRNVLKRYERLRVLMANGRWTEGQSVFGLPKLKAEKRKVKKAAAKEAAPAEGAEATPQAAAAKAPAAKAPAAK